MDKKALKEVLYGGIKELLYNEEFFYRSMVGSDFCHLTDAGKEAVMDYIQQMARKIYAAEEEYIKQRAIDSTFTTLKS